MNFQLPYCNNIFCRKQRAQTIEDLGSKREWQSDKNMSVQQETHLQLVQNPGYFRQLPCFATKITTGEVVLSKQSTSSTLSFSSFESVLSIHCLAVLELSAGVG